jgi:uncharacterized phage protein gp47/JayE
MAEYGLTSYGFIIKRLQNIIDELTSTFAGEFPDINTDAQSVCGQLINIVAKALADAWEVAQGTYNSQYPDTADGVSLDRVCEFNGISRNAPFYSSAVIACKGDEGTVIYTDDIVQTENKQWNYYAVTGGTITKDAANKMHVLISTVLNNTIYTILINNTTVSILSGSSATAQSIAAQLYNEINLLTNVLSVNALLPNPADGSLIIYANDTDYAFNAVPDSNMTILEFWTPIKYKTKDVGDISAAAGTINRIITPRAGFNEATNFKAATVGKGLESDTDLRIRRRKSIRKSGSGTVEALRARLLDEVEGILQAVVYNNVEDFVDGEGRPPHSIEALCDGGDDQEIADKIWLYKPGGIQTFGDVSVNVVDSDGEIQLIKFSRPIDVYIWFAITVTVDAALFPANGKKLIVDNILAASTEFGIGDDIIYQKFFCPIYLVQGVSSAIIEIARTNTLTPPGSYSSSNIVINDREVGKFDSSRINITVNTI